MATRKVTIKAKPKAKLAVDVTVTAQKPPAFWLIWREGSPRYVPTYRHDTEQGARQEAERLAMQNPNDRFYVVPCSEYAVATVNPVVFKNAIPEEEIPF